MRLLSLLTAAAVAASVAAEAQHRPRLECRPVHLYHGDTLTVVMASPHAPEMAIMTPDRAWFKISTSDSAMSIIPRSVFLSLHKLHLATSTFAGVPFVAGAATQVVFWQPGDYVIYLGDNLATEGMPVDSCRVHYEPRPRPQ